MKILLTARAFKPPFTGGVDVYADRLGKSLRRMGHSTVFLALDSSGAGRNIETTRETVAGERVWRFRFDLAQRPKPSLDRLYDPEMGDAFSKLLLEERPDLLIILNFYLLSMASVESAKSLGIPTIHIATDFIPICRRATLIRWDGSACRVGESVQSCAECFVAHRTPGRIAAGILNRVVPEKTLRRISARRAEMNPANPLRILGPYWEQVGITAERLDLLDPLRRSVDLVVTPTRFTREMFSRHGFDPQRVRLLPFGVEADGRLARVQKQRAPEIRFVFIGRLQPYKGVHVLVEAFQRLDSAAPARLLIYGKEDGYERYYRELLAEIERSDRITFEGSIPPERLHEAFSRADYFVLPSVWHENTPLILLDALQSGTPVIASDIGGVRDSVLDGVNGFLFKMGDSAALAAVLQKCIDHPAYLERLQPDADLPLIDDYAAALLSMAGLTE